MSQREEDRTYSLALSGLFRGLEGYRNTGIGIDAAVCLGPSIVMATFLIRRRRLVYANDIPIIVCNLSN